MTKRDKVTVDEVIGLIHTDEPTDSVEEVCKLRGRTNERFIVDTAGTLIDMETRNTYDYVSDVVDLLNGQQEYIQSLKNSYNRCRSTNRALHKDWDKLWRICIDNGMTEDEILKEMDR